jgi:adenylate kinase family enzyme
MRHLIDHEDFRLSSAALGMSETYVESFIESHLKGFTAAASPLFTHMLGIPGAGKSTEARKIKDANTVFIGFDDVMERLPGYRKDKNELGAEAAFRKWEICARQIGYEILFRAQERRLNILFDHSGTRADHVDMLKELKQKEKYAIRVVAVLIDEDLALERALTRERYLPPEYIPQRKQILDQLLPSYKSVADTYFEYKATKSGNILVFPKPADVKKTFTGPRP